MATTQQEIAERLSVSRSLVARVLSDTPGVRVSQLTRHRILHAAREMGYRPNMAARSLRMGKTHTVTFVHAVPPGDAKTYNYIDAVEGAAQELGRMGYDLKVRVVRGQAASLAMLRDMASSRSSDAAILWSSEEEVEEQALCLEEFGFPFVVKGRHEVAHPHWLQIDFDHEQMMAVAVRHLVGLGHRRIAYMGYDTNAVFGHHLKGGYETAMRSVADTAPESMAAIGPEASDAEQAMDRWLGLPADRQPTGLVIGAGVQAWHGVERALARVGRHIGEEPGTFGLAGMGAYGLTTLFGPGRCFWLCDLTFLATEMVRRLVRPLLEGQDPAERVIHLCPPLLPTKNLELLQCVSLAPRNAAGGCG